MEMEELLADRRSTAMSNTNPSSSSTLRFLGFIKQPESVAAPTIHDQLELHENDVVWSFSVSPAPSPSPSPPSPHHHHRHFSPANSGLSAALSDDHRHLIRRKSTAAHAIVPPATRLEENPPRFHQSAPMNIPMWPTELRRKHGNGGLDGVDEGEDDDDDAVGGDEEMVPPHVIVARSHVTFSVFEGAGRTLKGRDLRRVRNAVFQKTEQRPVPAMAPPQTSEVQIITSKACTHGAMLNIFGRFMSETVLETGRILAKRALIEP